MKMIDAHTAHLRKAYGEDCMTRRGIFINLGWGQTDEGICSKVTQEIKIGVLHKEVLTTFKKDKKWIFTIDKY